jgi:exonuclease III
MKNDEIKSKLEYEVARQTAEEQDAIVRNDADAANYEARKSTLQEFYMQGREKLSGLSSEIYKNQRRLFNFEQGGFDKYSWWRRQLGELITPEQQAAMLSNAKTDYERQ